MIPVNEPLLCERDAELVADCVRSGWISSAGKYLDAFESGWSSRCGMRHGVAMSSGTAALQVALRCQRLSPGDEVILPTFTIISCAMAILDAGATPVLVDADAATWCMDVDRIEERITPKTRGILAVHIYGHPVDFDPLRELARRRGLWIVEDAAEAHGARYLSERRTPAASWKPCGGLGDVSIFSFYANKLVTTGEGGMLLTDDDDVAERARSLRNLCFLPKQRFVHTELGYNFRMTNLQAALGVAQLERFDAIVTRKREIGRRYLEALRDIEDLELPVERDWARQVYWMFGVVLGDGVPFDAAEVARRLGRAGVETRPFFVGMHEQPVLRQRGLFEGESYPVSARLTRRGLYLPSGVALSDSAIDEVVACVRSAVVR
jgi:perosamine synthetase